MSKVSDLQARANKAYDNEDQRWFDALPGTDLGVLWGLACSEGVAYDDEVYEALDRRGWFDEPPRKTDQSVIDKIAVGLGTRAEWDSGELEWIAEAIGTVRPHPGDSTPGYARKFEEATGRKADPDYVDEADLDDDDQED